MFFEFDRDNFVRMIDDSGRALNERFEKALRNAAMAWRQAIDRRLRRLGVGLASWNDDRRRDSSSLAFVPIQAGGHTCGFAGIHGAHD